MPPKKTVNEWLDAIERVESGGDLDAIGDENAKGGPSRGPLQISRPYWTDAGMTIGVYENCWGPTAHFYSRLVVLCYMLRYCPAALAGRDWETCSRIHNGGPSGAKKKATLGYWEKVKKALG